MFAKKFLKKDTFDNYDDYIQNATPIVPENFNFAYDVIDVIAHDTPDKVAVLWTNDSGEKKTITFKMLSQMSGRMANCLAQRGIKKGDTVLLFMRRRWEYWVLMMAMHRVGIIPIPSTNQLKAEDIKFRVNMADVKTGRVNLTVCQMKIQILWLFILPVVQQICQKWLRIILHIHWGI